MRAFRTFAKQEMNRPENSCRVHPMRRMMEGTRQEPPGQALGDRGRRAVQEQENAEAFARTYANASRQVKTNFRTVGQKRR